MGMKERGGRMIAEPVASTSAADLRRNVLRTVKRGSTVSTDEWPGYNLLTGDGYVHGAVNHTAGEYGGVELFAARGPTLRASSCSMYSRNRPDFRAFASVSMAVNPMASALY